jgi:hypothetical protein
LVDAIADDPVAEALWRALNQRARPFTSLV